MAKGARFSKGEYELVAKVLRDTDEAFTSTDPEQQARLLTILAYQGSRFIHVFREDNPAFDVERFHHACGFNTVHPRTGRFRKEKQ